MKRLSSSQAVPVDWDGSPCRHLAARIIQQAFHDIASPSGSRCDQESARAFLSGSTMLNHWCAVADLDPAWMVARAARVTTVEWNGLPHEQDTSEAVSKKSSNSRGVY